MGQIFSQAIAVVIFGILFGIAALGVTKDNPARGESIAEFIETTQAVIMKLVHMIMALTPFGILALITKVVAGSDAADILNLLAFIVASYVAIAIMFFVHAGLLNLGGVNLLDYFRKVWPVLAFAFAAQKAEVDACGSDRS